MLPRLQRSQPMLLGQPDSKVLARLFGSWCFTKRKKIIQRCLSGSAVDLFWSQLLQKTVNCSLSEIWLQCSYSTLLKDFCNNTSVYLQQHFSISATTLQYFCNNTSVFLQLHFAFFATRSIYTEAQQNSFDPKKCYVTNTARGPNRPFRCLDGNCH